MVGRDIARGTIHNRYPEDSSVHVLRIAGFHGLIRNKINPSKMI